MRLRTLLVLIFLMANVVAAQETAAPPAPSAEPAIITVKTLSGDSFQRLTRLLKVFDAKFTADEKWRTIIVYASPTVVAQMRRVVEQLDRPGSEAALGHNIELTLSFLRCSVTSPSTATSLPADLEGVAKQLRAATQYRDIQLWDVIPVHLQEGSESRDNYLLPRTIVNGRSVASPAQVQIRPESISVRGGSRYVQLDPLHITLKVPVSADSNTIAYESVGLSTSGTFKEGQKTVLGKVAGADESNAVFVVVSLKILD